jgi:hypothetical protein
MGRLIHDTRRTDVRLIATGALIMTALALQAQVPGGVGRVSFSLEEWRSGPAGPGMRFVFQAEGVWSCSDIDAELQSEPSRLGTTIILGPFSSRPRPGPCPPTVTPAIGVRAITLGNGHWTLRVVNGTSSDEYAVEVTPVLIIVKPARAPTVSGAAYESELRVQRNSFALSCGALKDESSFCADVVRAIAGVSGIAELPVPSGAHGWQVQMNGYWYNEPTHYFSYTNDAALKTVVRLMRAKRKSVQSKTGFGLGLAFWDGQYFYASTD